MAYPNEDFKPFTISNDPEPCEQAQAPGHGATLDFFVDNLKSDVFSYDPVNISHIKTENVHNPNQQNGVLVIEPSYVLCKDYISEKENLPFIRVKKGAPRKYGIQGNSSHYHFW